MEADFTLVPIGGLGNRINAICSAIAYCKERNKSLDIIWFKDPGLNCSVKQLMSLNPKLTNVQMHDAGISDFLLRDKPRRRNFRIPKIFQRFLFDRRIYESEVYKVVSSHTKPDFGNIDHYKHIFMVNYWRFWQSEDMWESIVVNPDIKKEVGKIISGIKAKRIVGLHIRRTDNIYSIKESPTELFINKVNDEIEKYQDDVAFFLASDSLEEKDRLKKIFGEKIYTQTHKTSRNTPEGIIDAFTELIALSKTDKIYASSKSSFSELAHFIGQNEFEELIINE